MNKLRVAVIGCGNISVMHLDSVVALDVSELVAVCYTKPERANATAEKYNTKAYIDYQEMFQKEELDVVHICLPHYLHTVVARDAFRAGIHVISEKPMSIDYEDAVATVELAKQCNLQYGVIFQCRYNTPSAVVKKRITEGKLGAVKCARSTLTWYRPENYYHSSDWKGTWDKEGGGVIIDQAIHSLDLANWFINSEPIEVQASIANRAHDIMKVDDTGEGYIRYKNGATMAFWAMNNYGCDDPIEIRLCCEKGRVVMSYDDARIEFADGTVETVSQQDDGIYYEGGKDYWGFQHIRQIADFYHSVEEGTEPFISGKEALKIQKLICAIYESAKSGKTVFFEK